MTPETHSVWANPTFWLTVAVTVLNVIYLLGKWQQGTDASAAQNAREIAALRVDVADIKQDLKYRSEDAHELRNIVNALPHTIGREIAREYVTREVHTMSMNEAATSRQAILEDIRNLWGELRKLDRRRADRD